MENGGGSVLLRKELSQTSQDQGHSREAPDCVTESLHSGYSTCAALCRLHGVHLSTRRAVLPSWGVRRFMPSVASFVWQGAIMWRRPGVCVFSPVSLMVASGRGAQWSRVGGPLTLKVTLCPLVAPRYCESLRLGSVPVQHIQ